jgi:nitroimidazol reductase NimA-like FMN-containing flavoprotein (pyridoxamine 5'-phosphate oxidase superfamily)
MLIEDMPRPACIEFLQRVRFGRLACEQAGQPYVTPFYFACHQETLYGFSTVGQKIAWMRANPRVCVEADEVVSPQQWMSVVAFGHYEELPAEAAYDSDRKLAHSLLSQRPIWWEPGYARTVVGGNERPLDLVYFRVHVGEISGHRASP